MKKVLSLIFILIFFLTSCETNIINAPQTNESNAIAQIKVTEPEAKDPEINSTETANSDENDASATKEGFTKADFYIFSCDIPLPLDDPRLPRLPENLFDYVFELCDASANANSYSDECLSFEFPLTEYLEYKKSDGTISSSNTDCSKAGIIDSKEKLSAALEKGTKKKYSEIYTDDFFEKNIIFYISKYYSGSVFYEFEYGFDPETKLLAIHFTQPVKDMFMHSEMHHTYDYFITIPKEAITIDGKMIPYEELNFRLTGYIEK